MSKQPHTTYFKELWLEDERFSEWLEQCKLATQARCKLCKSIIELSSMGVSALVSHNTSVKHNKLLKARAKGGQTNLHFFMPSTSKAGTSKVYSEPEKAPKAKPATILQFANSINTSNAEIIWALKVVLSKYSLRSCEEIGKLYQKMFCDSDIANKFQMGKTKCGYYITYGIAPYFTDLIKKSVNRSPAFSVSFDESLNKVLQNEQMDMNVRYWDEESSLVKVNYITSRFFDRPNAENILDELLKGLKGHQERNVIQLSMDGPNTNWKVFELLQKHREEVELTALLNLGSCGLHVVHGAFKTGATASEWDVDKVLKAMCNIFKDSPGRRELYSRLNETDVFPLRFCATRWVEDYDVAIRAIATWHYIVKLVKHWADLSPSKQPQNNKSYDTLLKHYKDRTMVAKFRFFKHIASIFQGFLVLFQSDKPLTPFLSSELEKVLRQVMAKFVSPKVLEAASSSYTLIKINVDEKDSCLPTQLVKLGTATKECTKMLKLPADEKLKFKTGCLKFLKTLVKKLQERSPIKYAVVRNVNSLSPILMGNEPDVARLQFEGLLDKLYSTKRISEKVAEDARTQFDAFLSTKVKIEKERFCEFDLKNDRLDEFLGSFLKNEKQFSTLWDVSKIVFVFSHGQSVIERGFSVNKELLVENLKQVSLITQRTVYDYITSLNVKLHDYEITRDLTKSCKLAHSKYQEALRKNRDVVASTEKDRKRKLKMDEIVKLKKRKEALGKEIDSLEKDIVKYSIKADEKKDFAILSKSNAIRNAVNNKKQTVKTFAETLVVLETEYNSLK